VRRNFKLRTKPTHSKSGVLSNGRPIPDAAGIQGFLCPLATRSDGPEEMFEIASGHSSAVVTHKNPPVIDFNVNTVTLVAGTDILAKGLDSYCVNRVLDILPDKGERCFIDLLRDCAKNTLEFDTYLE
jgi:hypothetical protein